MKKNILQQVGTREETYTVTVIDTPETVNELGETVPAVTHEETRTRTVPVMSAVSVDMTPEEAAAMPADAPVAEPGAPDLEARVGTLEDDTATLTEAVNILLGVE